VSRYRLTPRGRDLAWACRFTAALLLGLLLVSAVERWI
jgi:hypothetical protein